MGVRRGLLFQILSVVMGLSVMHCAALKPKKSGATDGAPGDADGGGLGTSMPTVDEAATNDFLAHEKVLRSSKSGPDWKDMAGRMDEMTSKHPDHGLSWYNLAVAKEQQGDSGGAKDAYQKALRASPSLREAAENLIAMQLRDGNSEGALQEIRALVARDRTAAKARVVLAAWHLRHNQPDEARQLVDEALSANAEIADAYCVLTELALAEKDLNRVRLLASQGLKLNDSAACLHAALGRVAVAEKDDTLALAKLKQAVDLDPGMSEVRFIIGQMAIDYKDFQNAVAQYTEVTNAQPNNAAAYANMGVAYKGQGKFAEAEAAYQKALSKATGPDTKAATQFNLGVLYLRHMNRLDDAEAAFKTHLQLSSGDNDAAFQLIDEIQQQRAMEAEEKRLEAEMARQQEIEKKVQAEEAARAAEAPAVAPEEAAPAPKAKPVRRKKRRRTKKKAAPKKSATDGDDFE